MNEKVQIHSSSGNVFADLDLPNADELLIKAELIHQISELIIDRQLSESDAAEHLQLDKSQFSDLMRGKLSMFSIDRLFRFLNALGSNVEIRIVANSQPDLKAQTLVAVGAVSIEG
jgi:predicted XRE-type DNA-binding protein